MLGLRAHRYVARRDCNGTHVSFWGGRGTPGDAESSISSGVAVAERYAHAMKAAGGARECHAPRRNSSAHRSVKSARERYDDAEVKGADEAADRADRRATECGDILNSRAQPRCSAAYLLAGYSFHSSRLEAFYAPYMLEAAVAMLPKAADCAFDGVVATGTGPSDISPPSKCWLSPAYGVRLRRWWAHSRWVLIQRTNFFSSPILDDIYGYAAGPRPNRGRRAPRSRGQGNVLSRQLCS